MNRTRATEPPAKMVRPQASRWPSGTDANDRKCWLCGGRTNYRQCKIICSNCGFTRDCSDP